MPTPLTPEEIAALDTYAARHGRTWKAQLRADWEAARTTGTLQELRNSLDFGPAGLISYRPSSPASPQTSAARSLAAPLSIRFDQVRIGDRLFNRLAYHPSAAWSRVVAVTRAGSSVLLETAAGWSTCGHPAEGIAVKLKPENVLAVDIGGLPADPALYEACRLSLGRLALRIVDGVAYLPRLAGVVSRG